MRPLLTVAYLGIGLPALCGAQDTSTAAQLAHRATVLVQIGRLDQAILHGRRVIELAPDDPAGYSNLGSYYVLKGELDSAVPALRKAIALDPRHRPAYSTLGNAYTDAGKLDSAIALHRAAIALDSTDAGPYIDLGTALERSGLVEESMQQFRRAVTLDPNRAMGWYDLAVTYFRLKRWPETLDALITANDLDENYPGLYQALQEVSGEARTTLEHGVRSNPADPLAHYYLAYAYSYQREWGKAFKEIDRAAELDASRSQFPRARVWFESRRGKNEQAIAAAKACAPADWSCQFVVGSSYHLLSRPREALGALQKAASINPNVVNVQQNLGAVYVAVGEHEEAVAAFERALALGAQSPLVHFNLAVAYGNAGAYDSAWHHARIAERMRVPSAPALMQDFAKRSAEPEW